jgi:hypothetical protein
LKQRAFPLIFIKKPPKAYKSLKFKNQTKVKEGKGERSLSSKTYRFVQQGIHLQK